MSKKRKPIVSDDTPAETSASRSKIATTLGDKLKAAGILKPSANREKTAAQSVDSDHARSRDRDARRDKCAADRDELNRAYMGAKRLQNQKNKRVRKRVASIDVVENGCEHPDDQTANARELNLLAPPNFEIRWDYEGDVTALRREVESDQLRSLFSGRFKPEATLDLHGTVSKDLERRVARFVFDQYRRGVRRVLIVHGKGKHSVEGVGVLVDHLVKVLTQTRVSHYVLGFYTASLDLGGSGALAVLLVS